MVVEFKDVLDLFHERYNKTHGLFVSRKEIAEATKIPYGTLTGWWNKTSNPGRQWKQNESQIQAIARFWAWSIKSTCRPPSRK